jgi:acyl-CoA oxidase
VNNDDRVVMTALLRGSRADSLEDAHDDLRELFGLEIFDRQDGLSAAQRARLIGERLRFAMAYLEPVRELVANPRRVAAVHEWAVMVDCALAAVLASHCNLVLSVTTAGGGDDAHPRSLLAELASGEALGVVLAAELGCGDDPGLRTLAEYDPETAQFVLRTPDARAQKILPDLVSPDTAVTAVVLARLVVGDQEHGVFPFLMRLTTADGPSSGVWITHVPPRPGWPLETGIVSFDGARVPLAALLSGQHAHLTRDGRLVSTLLGRRERLRQSLEREQTRNLCVGAGSLAMAKAALSMIAGLADSRELLPWIADTFAAMFLHNVAQRAVENARSAGGDSGDVRLAASAKALATRTAARILAESRAVCGLEAMLTADRIAQYLVAAYVAADTVDGNQLIMAETYQPPASAAPPAYAGLLDPDLWRYLLGERERRRRRDLDEAARLALDAYIDAIAQAEAGGAASAPAASGAGATLRRLAALHVLWAVRADAAWFVAERLLTPGQLAALEPTVDSLLVELAAEAADLVAAFDIPEEVLRAPTADAGHRLEQATAGRRRSA